MTQVKSNYMLDSGNFCKSSSILLCMSLPVSTLRSARPRSLPATVALLSAPQQSRKSSGRCLVMVLPWRLASQTPSIKNRLLYVHRERGGEAVEFGVSLGLRMEG